MPRLFVSLFGNKSGRVSSRAGCYRARPGARPLETGFCCPSPYRPVQQIPILMRHFACPRRRVAWWTSFTDWALEKVDRLARSHVTLLLDLCMKPFLLCEVPGSLGSTCPAVYEFNLARSCGSVGGALVGCVASCSGFSQESRRTSEEACGARWIV